MFYNDLIFPEYTHNLFIIKKPLKQLYTFKITKLVRIKEPLNKSKKL